MQHPDLRTPRGTWCFCPGTLSSLTDYLPCATPRPPYTPRYMVFLSWYSVEFDRLPTLCNTQTSVHPEVHGVSVLVLCRVLLTTYLVQHPDLRTPRGTWCFCPGTLSCFTDYLPCATPRPPYTPRYMVFLSWYSVEFDYLPCATPRPPSVHPEVHGVSVLVLCRV